MESDLAPRFLHVKRDKIGNEAKLRKYFAEEHGIRLKKKKTKSVLSL